LSIDIINGSSLLREWVDNDQAFPEDLEKITRNDEIAWQEERLKFLLY
jgi:hypothetical protein